MDQQEGRSSNFGACATDESVAEGFRKNAELGHKGLIPDEKSPIVRLVRDEIAVEAT